MSHGRCLARPDSERRLEGVNRRNLKVIDFEHELHPRLALERV
jgi:hypothetical protein